MITVPTNYKDLPSFKQFTIHYMVILEREREICGRGIGGGGGEEERRRRKQGDPF